MHTYNADVQYTTKKGNPKRASFGVTANNIDEARDEAKRTILLNGQRQCNTINNVAVKLVGAPSKPGFFARLLGRG